jgi:hypothetical protein
LADPKIAVMAVGSLLVSALSEAIAHNRDLQTKWIQANTRLVAVSGEVGLLRYQPDYRIDLVLRAMEDEGDDHRQRPGSCIQAGASS